MTTSTLNSFLKRCWQSVVTFFTAPDQIQLNIFPSCDPNVWLLVNAPDTLGNILGKSDAVIIESGVRRARQFASGQQKVRYQDIEPPDAFQYNIPLDQARLGLEREGHKKSGKLNEASHKDHLKIAAQSLAEHGKQQSYAEHPLLKKDARFAGVEKNMNPLPSDNEFAAAVGEKLENLLTPRPGQNATPTNTPFR